MSYRIEDARAVAEKIVEGLRPACAQIEIAGSIRRGKLLIKDIEIVARPKPADTLFERMPAEDYALFEDKLKGIILGEKWLRYDEDLDRDGLKYKRLKATVHPVVDIPVDLFIANANNWGNILAIRTGDADFSRLLVTQTSVPVLCSDGLKHYGFMPSGFKHSKGYLYWAGRLAPVPCPTEEAFFDALEFKSVPDPSIRNLSYKKER
jgi:hypothetical protein